MGAVHGHWDLAGVLPRVPGPVLSSACLSGLEPARSFLARANQFDWRNPMGVMSFITEAGEKLFGKG